VPHSRGANPDDCSQCRAGASFSRRLILITTIPVNCSAATSSGVGKSSARTDAIADMEGPTVKRVLHGPGSRWEWVDS
jgi:hypothetical protein